MVTYSCIDCDELDQTEDRQAAKRHAEYNNHCVVKDEEDED